MRAFTTSNSCGSKNLNTKAADAFANTWQTPFEVYYGHKTHKLVEVRRPVRKPQIKTLQMTR